LSRISLTLTLALTLSCILPLSATTAASIPFSTKWATRLWQTEIGTAGSAIIAREPSGWGQAWVFLSGLRPSTHYYMAVREGTCSALGARIAYDASPQTDSTGTLDWALNALTPSQMRTIQSAAHFSIVVGSARRCATFPTPATSCAARSAPSPWKDLILVYPETAITYRAADGTDTNFAAAFTTVELDQLQSDAAAMSAMASAWSGGATSLRATVTVVDHALHSVTPQGTGGGYAVTENDIRTDLNRYAPIGRFDNVTVVWKAPSGAGTTMPLWAWSTSGGCVSVHVNSTGFTTLAVTDVAAPIIDELLHLWLETVVGYYSHFGFRPIPNLDAFGNGAYTYDPVNGWASFYQAFMTGSVVDAQGKSLGGIRKAMWASGTPTTRPVGCYWFHDP
jgi:hypothetical protein